MPHLIDRREVKEKTDALFEQAEKNIKLFHAAERLSDEKERLQRMLDAAQQRSAEGEVDVRNDIDKLEKQNADNEAVIKHLRMEVARLRGVTATTGAATSSLRTDTQISSMSSTIRSSTGVASPSFTGLGGEMEEDALRRKVRALQQKNAGLKSRLASLEMGIQQVDVLKQRNMDLFDRISDLKTLKKHDKIERCVVYMEMTEWLSVN